MRSAVPAILCLTLSSATALAAPSLEVKDGVATIQIPRKLVEGSPAVTVTLALPAGWKQSENKPDDMVLVPETAKYDRPAMTVNVQMDNLDPKTVAKRIDEKIRELGKVVVGGGRIKLLGTKKRPDGAWLSRSIDAKKERDIQYVETTCLVARPGQPFVVQVLGFAETKDAALVPLFEKTCASVQVVGP
jgi:hypothetical protein